MRIYLDTCCLQRSLDDQAHPRVQVETVAVFAVLASVLSGQHTLLGSEALDYEIARIPDATRRAEALSVLKETVASVLAGVKAARRPAETT